MYEIRLDHLKRLKSALHAHNGEILAALRKDLGKSEAEAYTTEISMVLHELGLTLRNLKQWMRPKKAATPSHLQPGYSRIYTEPLGKVLIIGPWNYPLQLSLCPLIGALAAGNTAVLKPSELAPHTSAVLKKMLESIFDKNLVEVIEGGIEPTQTLLKKKFDFIFFTGSTGVGKIVYQAAAEHLTPVVLELGGKSPVIVNEDADLALAARRIVWGKFMNAGQTCVAPDYLYAHSAIAETLIEEMKKVIAAHYGPDAKQSPDYGRIVNSRNFLRLVKLMDRGTIAAGGAKDLDKLYIAPTLITGLSWQDPVMQEEIFGPLLPVLTFAKIEDAYKEIRGRGKPLAAYLFTSNKKTEKDFIAGISFGGGCINDTVLHLANSNLPFGGVGGSGSGAYHGELSYLTFSHKKSILHKSRWLDIALRYPPFTQSKFKWLKRLLG